MSHELLVGPATVFTNTQDDPVRANAGVLCVDDRITEVGPWSDLLAKHGSAQRLQAEGKLVLPGLINAHHHLYSTFARGMPIPQGTSLANFPEILEGIWWRLDRALDLDAVEAGAYPPVMDCLRWGTTTIVDHHASPNAILGSLERLARVCDEAGVRASLCYEITDRNGPDGAAKGIAENASFAQACHGKRGRSALLGLHASFTVSDETLAQAAKVVRSDTPIHVHVAEDASDVTRTREQFGRGIVERLEAHGLLRSNSVLVHGIHLSDGELDRIAQAGAWLVHNPESNANNAVGHLDVERALERGVRVVLGTDGMASNMLRAAKSAYLMTRHARRDPTVGFGLPRKLLFENNVALGRALFGEPKLGAIEAGAPADLCLVDYDAPTKLCASTFDGHLVFGITEAPVLATVSGGRLRAVRGVMVELDVEEIRRRVLSEAEKVWERLGR
jgi:putative selenium metabolism protein SsnA